MDTGSGCKRLVGGTVRMARSLDIHPVVVGSDIRLVVVVGSRIGLGFGFGHMEVADHVGIHREMVVHRKVPEVVDHILGLAAHMAIGQAGTASDLEHHKAADLGRTEEQAGLARIRERLVEEIGRTAVGEGIDCMDRSLLRF